MGLDSKPESKVDCSTFESKTHKTILGKWRKSKIQGFFAALRMTT